MVTKRVLALAGGVGGAKLALGLADVLPPERLTIVVNTGDDEDFYGLHVSPDLDTVMYTLAGLANPETGWGLQDDSFRVLDQLRLLGDEAWFGLGDLDLATHIRRAELLRQGLGLTDVTRELCRRLGVAHSVAPMTDGRVRTILDTNDGTMSFQEYFVHRRCEPVVQTIRYEGADSAKPSSGFLEALQTADAIVVCPSNPFLSIDPILAVRGVRLLLNSHRGRPVCVVSPIISGEAVKGPAAKLFAQVGGGPASALSVCRHYDGLATHFVLDQRDEALTREVESLGCKAIVAETLMTDNATKVALARAVCAFLGVETE